VRASFSDKSLFESEVMFSIALSSACTWDQLYSEFSLRLPIPSGSQFPGTVFGSDFVPAPHQLYARPVTLTPRPTRFPARPTWPVPRRVVRVARRSGLGGDTDSVAAS
jgi:hypothetical protein